MNALSACTLLYVEDEPALRSEMTTFLAMHCARVIPAAGGRQALELAADNAIDLVMTDIRMPEMDGLSLSKRLLESNPGLPIVLYTAFTEVQSLIRGIELGVAGFVQKPTNAAKLVEVLEKAALPVVQRRQISELSRQLQNAVSCLAKVGGHAPAPLAAETGAPEHNPLPAPEPPEALPLSMSAIEKWALRRALDAAGGKRMVAARLLGMNYYTFKRHLVRHGLADDDES
ncbi:MAG: response regulator [Deltaproteobacteria bacterium]|nr:MAG: response regulator [Deltaproteobacteria bacterium]